MLDAYLGQTSAAVRLPSGLVRAVDQGMESGLAECLLLAKEKLGRWSSRSFRLWLSGALARPFIVGPTGGIKRWSEALALAEAQAVSVAGFKGPCRLSLEGWPEAHPSLAIAMESETLHAIESVSLRSGMKLASLRPWWSCPLNSLLAQGQTLRLLSVFDGDALTVVTAQDGHPATAATYTPRPEQPNAESLLTRLMLANGLSRSQMRMATWDPSANNSGAFGVAWRQHGGDA